ncbi:MAG: hypothetical protein MJ204_03995 [Bacteroidales bacterium]|nr:hypothetical protein [Bacteroidales bacterium]
MRKIVVLLYLFLSCCCYAQQQASDVRKIFIKAIQPEYDNIPEEARLLLENKMKKIVLANGLSDDGIYERFVLTAKINILSKDITPTAPPKVSQKIEVTFFVGDVIENKIYGSTSIMVAGIGENENKAFIQAFQRINAQNPKIQELLTNSKHRIIEYYSSNCNKILTEAKNLQNSQQYDEAIAKLVSVPYVCEDCYTKANDEALNIYNEKINTECLILIQQAKSTWLVKRDYACGDSALTILSQINPKAECLPQAQDLIEQINNRLRAIEAAEAAWRKEQWEWKKKQYEDKLSMEKQQQADKTMLLSQAIGAIENIGVAFGKNQPQVKNTTTNNVIRSW